MSRLLNIFIFLISITLVDMVAAHPQSGKTIPITIDSLQSRDTKNGAVRFIVHSPTLGYFFPKGMDQESSLLRFEFWNFDRTELFSSLEVDNNLVMERNTSKDENGKYSLMTWDLNDSDGFDIESFDVKNEQVEIEMTLYPSRIPDVIDMRCVSVISGKTLGPLNCKQIEARP